MSLAKWNHHKLGDDPLEYGVLLFFFLLGWIKQKTSGEKKENRN